jgi:hypothetical protein
MDQKLEVQSFIAEDQAKARVKQIQDETLELALAYAQDIVNIWPNVSIRTLSTVTDKVNALREALKLLT